MVFKGKALPLGELLERAEKAPVPDWRTISDRAVLRHTARSSASECTRMLASGDSPSSCWRFGILQTLDDYTSAVRRGSLALGQMIFEDEPHRTGSREIDAAFAALDDHLAERDGWDAPAWAQQSSRTTSAWYPNVPSIFRNDAERESPRAFRERGIFLPATSLDRA